MTTPIPIMCSSSDAGTRNLYPAFPPLATVASPRDGDDNGYAPVPRVDGSVARIVLGRSGVPAQATVPPCRLAICRTRVRPRPAPEVVCPIRKNGEKTRSRSPAATPAP